MDTIIDRALNLTEFIGNYTKCAFDETERTDRCAQFEDVVQTYQGQLFLPM